MVRLKAFDEYCKMHHAALATEVAELKERRVLPASKKTDHCIQEIARIRWKFLEDLARQGNTIEMFEHCTFYLDRFDWDKQLLFVLVFLECR